jgi:hypothetical protein
LQKKGCSLPKKVVFELSRLSPAAGFEPQALRVSLVKLAFADHEFLFFILCSTN